MALDSFQLRVAERIRVHPFTTTLAFFSAAETAMTCLVLLNRPSLESPVLAWKLAWTVLVFAVAAKTWNAFPFS